MTQAEKAARRQRAITLYLSGLSYPQVAATLGLSLGYMRHVIGPPETIRHAVWRRAAFRCERCHTECPSGHIHHREREGIDWVAFNAPSNLEYLCLTCHRAAHKKHRPKKDDGWYLRAFIERNPKAPLIRPGSLH